MDNFFAGMGTEPIRCEFGKPVELFIATGAERGTVEILHFTAADSRTATTVLRELTNAADKDRIILVSNVSVILHPASMSTTQIANAIRERSRVPFYNALKERTDEVFLSCGFLKQPERLRRQGLWVRVPD